MTRRETPAESAPLVDRAAELEALGDFLARLASGAPGMVLVEGEPGIGKSRLVEEALQRAARLGIAVSRAHGEELERSRPFGIIADALDLRTSSPDPIRAGIARLLVTAGAEPADMSLGVSSGPALRYRIAEEVLGLVEGVAEAGPVVLVLDDLHWADPSSLVTLHLMARRLRHLPVGVVATLRPLPRSTELDRLVDLVGADRRAHLVLRPLDGDDVEALVTGVLGAPPSPRLRAEIDQAGGNPLFVVELLRALSDEGALHVDAGRVDLPGPGRLPRSLRLVLLRRLSHLSASTLEILRVASVLGTTFDVTQLAAVTGRSAVELMPALDEAVRGTLLDDAGPRLAFRHELLRQAVYADLVPAIRAGLHRHVAAALAEAGAPTLQVAEHYALGAAAGDVEAARWLHSAARDTVSQAPGTAVELLERGLEVVGADEQLRRRLSADLVVARLWSGGIEAAESLARELLARHLDPDLDALVRFGLIEALLAQGRTVEALQESQRAMSEPGTPDAARGRLLAIAAFGPLYAGDRELARSAAEIARREGERAGDDLAVCMAACAQCHLAVAECRLDDAVRHGREAVTRAERSPTRAASFFQSGTFLGLALLYADRFADAERAFDQGRRLSEELGAAWNVPMYHWAFVWLRFAEGRWDDAMAEAEAGFELMQEVPARIGAVSVHATLAVIALHRNDLRTAHERLAQGEAELAATGPQPGTNRLFWVKAMLEEIAGNRQSAVVALDTAWKMCHAAGAAVEQPLVGPDYVRLLVAEGEADQAGRITEAVEQVAARTGTASATGSALRCRGLTGGDAAILVEAATTLRGASRPLDHAHACEDAAAALAAGGRITEAAALLEEALDAHDALGARRDAARVEADMRSLGIRRGRRGARRPRPSTGWESLTRTEHEVVRLIDEGLSNRDIAQRLFVSPRTVETHLSHVFAKLGVSNRSELKTAAAQRSSLPEEPPAAPTAPAGGPATH